MLIAHVADVHLSERRGDSYATLAEQVDILRWIGRDAVEHGARAMLVAGDVFDSRATEAEINAAVEVVQSWAERLPVVAVCGNHDRPGALDVLGELRTRHPVAIYSRPAEHLMPDGTVIACLPWPRKAALVAAMGSTSGLEVEQGAAAAMRAILMGFGAAFERHSGARILLAHAELGAALSDSGQPMVGRCDVELGAGDLLDTGADYIALGHIHKHQVIEDRICYAGAPRQCTFGEDAVKGYCLVDIDRGRAPVITHRQGPGRQLVTVRFTWDEETGALDAIDDPPESVTGKALRLEYEVSEETRRQAADKAAALRQRWLDAGAHSVRIDARTIATHRVRSEEIRTARTTADKLEALWASRGARPGRAAELLAKLNQLETEVAS